MYEIESTIASPDIQAVLHDVETCQIRNETANLLGTSVRERSAADTLAHIEPLFDRFGIGDIIDLSLPSLPACPVFQIVRKKVRSEFLSSGKGYGLTEALVSGLMESIETHCFEYPDPALLVETTVARSSENLPIIDAESLGGGGKAGPTSHVVRGYDHINKCAVWISADQAFFELEPGVLSQASANGLASGNSVEEAISHGLAELFERHALSAHSNQATCAGNGAAALLERVVPPAESRHMQACLKQLGAMDISAEFILISAEAGVAVFICYLDVSLGNGRRGAIQGYGAHVNPEIAMSRALAEAVQLYALFPPDADQHAPVEVAGERSILTTKKAAKAHAADILTGRLNDYQALCNLRAELPPTGFDYLPFFDDPHADVYGSANDGGGGQVSTILDQMLDGLRSIGYEHFYSCVISSTDLPVSVVKCFCPGFGSIAGL